MPVDAREPHLEGQEKEFAYHAKDSQKTQIDVKALR